MKIANVSLSFKIRWACILLIFAAVLMIAGYPITALVTVVSITIGWGVADILAAFDEWYEKASKKDP